MPTSIYLTSYLIYKVFHQYFTKAAPSKDCPQIILKQFFLGLEKQKQRENKNIKPDI